MVESSCVIWEYIKNVFKSTRPENGTDFSSFTPSKHYVEERYTHPNLFIYKVSPGTERTERTRKDRKDRRDRKDRKDTGYKKTITRGKIRKERIEKGKNDKNY